MQSAGLLDVSGLQVSYDRTQALFDASLTIGEGQFVSLLGRNGMGKSTIVKAIFGLVKINGGNVRFRDEPIAGLPPFQIANRGLGLVPEGRRVIGSLSVEENVVAFARKNSSSARQWDLERIYQTFPRLKERKNALGKTLSGGEQQMLAIARALATNPRLLVLDEATEGLAPIICEEIWACLKLLKSEGLAILVIDKDLGSLLALADKHFIIEKGKTVWNGNSDEYRAQSEQLQRYLTL